MSFYPCEELDPFVESVDEMHRPGAYALDLSRPAHPEDAWARYYETLPEWWEAFCGARGVVYVGAASDVLHRLEDHRDGEHRRAALLRICDISGLRTIWWAEDYENATVAEYNLAVALANERPDIFVHQR